MLINVQEGPNSDEGLNGDEGPNSDEGTNGDEGPNSDAGSNADQPWSMHVQYGTLSSRPTLEYACTVWDPFQQTNLGVCMYNMGPFPADQPWSMHVHNCGNGECTNSLCSASHKCVNCNGDHPSTSARCHKKLQVLRRINIKRHLTNKKKYVKVNWEERKRIPKKCLENGLRRYQITANQLTICTKHSQIASVKRKKSLVHTKKSSQGNTINHADGVVI
ncbi:unnamed protein product [Mytilus edulis]|uniref:Uncharacterized protein n=1 Tax=Mytilus edulis TaxID=6550 RepID=A0A8S3TIT3_MYTED|nr:unnamed protein product [Mytilus edulis]